MIFMKASVSVDDGETSIGAEVFQLLSTPALVITDGARSFVFQQCARLCTVALHATLGEEIVLPMKNPPHPGRHIKGAMEELNLSVARAAEALGVTRSALNRVANGTSSISPEMALRLEIVIGSTAEAWLRLQAAYDAAEVRTRADEIGKGLKRIPAAPPAGTAVPR
jgi:addiction module HigA family antidote